MNYDQLRSLASPYNYILDSITLIVCLTGIILSSLVLSVVFKREWRSFNIDLKLVTITLISDLLTGVLCLINSLCNFFNVSAYLSSWAACNMNGTLVFLTFITSINLVGVVGIERCLLVVFDKRLKERTYYILIGSLCILNLFCCILPWIFNGYVIMPSTMYCLFDLETWSGKTANILLLTSAGISLVMVYAGYTLIVFKRRQRERNIRNNLRHLSKTIQQNPSSTSLKSLTVIAASTLTNTPYLALVLVSLINPAFFTPAVDMVCTACIMCNQVLNTIMVVNMRSDLKEGLKSILGIKTKVSDYTIPLSSDISYPKE